MQLEELLSTIKKLNQALIDRHPKLRLDQDKQVLARVAKVSEEYGELVDEILSSLNLQRDDKLSHFDKSNLSLEFVDVFITLLLLGDTLDIDMKKAIELRLEAMYQKYGKMNDPD